MTVYFHGSFGLNRRYMAGILAASIERPKATADELAAPFGYKAPFTGRYRSWLHKTGLTVKGRKTQFTPRGEVVWRKDPKLESPTTQWFMHHELCEDPERAEAWHFFSHEFAKKHSEFGIDQLEDALAMKLMPHHPTHFGRGSSMIKVIARKIVQCYTQEEALGSLGILGATADGGYKLGQSVSHGPWDSPSSLAKSYK